MFHPDTVTFHHISVSWYNNCNFQCILTTSFLSICYAQLDLTLTQFMVLPLRMLVRVRLLLSFNIYKTQLQTIYLKLIFRLWVYSTDDLHRFFILIIYMAALYFDVIIYFVFVCVNCFASYRLRETGSLGSFPFLEK